MFYVECYNNRYGIILGETMVIRLKTVKGVLNRLFSGVKFTKDTDTISIYYAFDMHSKLKLVASFKVENGIIKNF